MALAGVGFLLFMFLLAVYENLKEKWDDDEYDDRD